MTANEPTSSSDEQAAATSARRPPSTVSFVLDGAEVVLVDDGATLLDALRGPLGATSVKDGCSPQGQCGCCTVLVDGTARVACVTPLRRVAGRSVTTFDGIDEAARRRWVEAFVAHGASQCGFCSPGIVVRLESLRRKSVGQASGQASGLRPGAVERALAAHLCRCTGWQTILTAAEEVIGGTDEDGTRAERDFEAASRRATLELGAPQRVGPDVVAGAVGFSADTAPGSCLVAVPDSGSDDGWVSGGTLAAARGAAGKVQGRRSTVDPVPPLEVPEGDWTVTLRTGWVDAAYVETDSSWCEPGGSPSSAAANGGAFGAKRSSPLPGVARALADEHGRPVLVQWSREDCSRSAPKRPPIAAGIRADGTGVVRVVRTDGIAERIRSVAPGLDVVEVDVVGPPTSAALRAAGWAEAIVLLAGVAATSEVVAVEPSTDADPERVTVRTGDGAVATASVHERRIRIRAEGGALLDPVVARSYCIGAAHMAYSWVTSEGIAVAADGEVLDLTVRSLGVLRAADTPHIDVELVESDAPPVRMSDAVFASVAAATWRFLGTPPDWPTGAPSNS